LGEDNVVPGRNGSDDAEAAIRAGIGTSRAVIDATKYQGLDSLPGFPFEVRTSAALRVRGRREPDRRLYLETLVRVALENCLLKPVARDLRHFEAFYPDIEPLTYVWYQFRFTMMAKGLVDAAGPNMLRRLWDAFALSDEQLAGVLGGRVHPTAGQWLASWSEPRAQG